MSSPHYGYDEEIITEEGEHIRIYYTSPPKIEKTLNTSRKPSGRKNVESKITFHPGDEPSKYCVANDYDILDSDDGRLIFLLYNEYKGYDKPAEKPILYYDGKEHAMLLHENFPPLLCDYIHVQARPKLLLQKTITFVFVAKDGNGSHTISTMFEATLTLCDDIKQIFQFEI